MWSFEIPSRRLLSVFLNLTHVQIMNHAHIPLAKFTCTWIQYLPDQDDSKVVMVVNYFFDTVLFKCWGVSYCFVLDILGSPNGTGLRWIPTQFIQEGSVCISWMSVFLLSNQLQSQNRPQGGAPVLFQATVPLSCLQPVLGFAAWQNRSDCTTYTTMSPLRDGCKCSTDQNDLRPGSSSEVTEGVLRTNSPAYVVRMGKQEQPKHTISPCHLQEESTF